MTNIEIISLRKTKQQFKGKDYQYQPFSDCIYLFLDLIYLILLKFIIILYIYI